MSIVNFRRTYHLGEAYKSIEERTRQMLGKYPWISELIKFDDLEKSVNFSTERLIPATSKNRPRVLLLFSNPHPHSVHQGMFLSPNTKGQENLFWPVMRDASWLSIPEENREPKQLADICFKADYPGPFDLIFYCYYAFPTDYPEDIRKIFGTAYFSQFIEPESKDEFRKTVQNTSAEAVVTFNKGIFNLVSEDPIDRYIKRLVDGELVQSRIEGVGRTVPIYLTFPTGWRYHKNYRQLRKDSLERIRTAIFGGLNTVLTNTSAS